MTNETTTAAGDLIVPAAAAEALAGGSSSLALIVDSDVVLETRRTQRGMVSAEWAVGIIAAIAIAGVLLAVVTSDPVKAALLKFILTLIHTFSGGLK
jgi:hypothetical protein